MITNKKIILASNSPRRKELLKGLDVDFEIRIIKGIDEHYPPHLPPRKVAQYIAGKKAEAYTIGQEELLITADTIVVVGNEILGKPKDEAEASFMLRKLSGKTHHVVTGVCLATTTERRLFDVCTEVTFKELSDTEINYYISHYHPLDKAGAYGIQEWIGYIGVTALNGSYFNVMGLPVQRIYQEIKRMKT